VPWDELPDDRREIDREHVRAIPELLASVGLKAVREGVRRPEKGVEPDGRLSAILRRRRISADS
jgi:hypothetical protein